MGPREFRELLTHHHSTSLLIDLCSAEKRSRDYGDTRLELVSMSKGNQQSKLSWIADGRNKAVGDQGVGQLGF